MLDRVMGTWRARTSDPTARRGISPVGVDVQSKDQSPVVESRAGGGDGVGGV